MMKKLLIIMLSVLMSGACLTAAEINGDMSEIDGKKVLRLYGTHQERGYAYGYLAGDMIEDILVNYLFGIVFMGNAENYGNIKTQFSSIVNVDQRFIDEANSIVQGMLDAGYGADYEEATGQSITGIDLLIGTGIVDIMSIFGCSSIMSWGDATDEDPELQGELVITRHLDWSNYQVLKDNYLIIVHNPSEENEQKWVSIAVAGLMGCLSAINENGTTVFHHMGNEDSYDYLKPFNEIFLSIRKGLELKDYNDDGKHDSQDVYDAVAGDVQAGGYIVDVANSVASGNTPFIIECDYHSGAMKRELADNTEISGTNLCATNHFRKLATPEYCSRYDGLVELLNESDSITCSRSWDVLSAAAGTNYNLQTIQFVPATGKLTFAYSVDATPAYASPQTTINIAELFAPISVEPAPESNCKKFKVSPNPVRQHARIMVDLPAPTELTATVYDASGKYIETIYNSSISAGVHYIDWDCSAYSTGSYVCTISYDGNKREIVKIISE